MHYAPERRLEMILSRRKSIAAGMMICMMLVLGGCAEYEEAAGGKNGIVVHADQSLDATMIRTFDQAYYNESELVAMVEDELVKYNGEHGADAISLKAHSQTGQQVSLTLHFHNWEDYNNYMLDRIYVGNVQGAYDERYDFNQALSDASKKEYTIGKNDLMNMADQKIIVFEGDHSVEAPGNIRYYTQGMKLTGAKCVESTQEGLYFIIY